MKTGYVFGAVSLLATAMWAQGDMAQQVQKKLGSGRFKDVHVTSDGGNVTLSGSVRVLADKMDAENKARHADHVSNVNNQIQVSTSAPDAELQRKLSQKISFDRVGY